MKEWKEWVTQFQAAGCWRGIERMQTLSFAAPPGVYSLHHLALQIDEGLPVYVVPMRPLARVPVP